MVDQDQTPVTPTVRQSRSHMGVILVLASLVRLGTVWYAVNNPTADWPVGGGNEYAVLARSLLAGHGVSSPFGGSTGPTAFVPPGYVFLVAGIFAMFGPQSPASIAVVLLLQTAFSIATIAVMMQVAKKVFDVRTATIAGVVGAFSIPTIWMPTIFWDTCLSALLLTGMVAIALRSCERPGMPIWIAMGSLTGLAGLVNPSLLPALVAVMGWCAFRQRTNITPFLRPALATLTLLLVFSPWPIRNLNVMHAFIPFRSNLGFELWDGNYPGSNGKFIVRLHPYYNQAERNRYKELGEVAYMQEKASIAKANIRANPLHFVSTTCKRVWDFWLGLAQKDEPPAGIIVLHALLSTLSGAAGMVLLLKKNRSVAWLFLLPLLIFPLPYYVTHADLRFRLLVDPLLTILGSYAFVQLLAHLAGDRDAKVTARENAPEEVAATL